MLVCCRRGRRFCPFCPFYARKSGPAATAPPPAQGGAENAALERCRRRCRRRPQLQSRGPWPLTQPPIRARRSRTRASDAGHRTAGDPDAAGRPLQGLGIINILSQRARPLRYGQRRLVATAAPLPVLQRPLSPVVPGSPGLDP